MAMHEWTARRTWRCPDETQLAAFVDEGLAPRERARVAAHAAGCDYCAGQIGALARLEETEPPSAIPPALLARARALPPVSAAPLGWRWGMAAAAAACFVVILTFSVRAPRPAGDSAIEAVRKAPDSTAAPELLFPREGAVVKRQALVFRWRPVERSLYYDIRVLSADGDPIWNARINGTEAQIPQSIRLAPSQKYYASVDAWLPEGKSVKCPVVGFAVRDQ
jgi:hypothetical protein